MPPPSKQALGVGEGLSGSPSRNPRLPFWSGYVGDWAASALRDGVG